MDKKNEVRKLFLKFRQNLTREQVELASQEITNEFLQLQEVIDSWRFMLYYSYRNEIETRTLIERLLQEEKEVYLPYCIVEQRRLEISPIINLDRDLTGGTYGIKEPRARVNTPLERLDIVVVPGLAFNRKGYRIGYGGGYYDRFIERLPARTTTVGFTYQAMLAESLPVEEYDLPVDIVITEKEVIYTGGGDN